jgi:ubiquinone/menaquinone biosynthesis C-methylase UbiE
MSHWQKISSGIVEGSLQQLDWYDWKAREFEKKMAGVLDLTGNKNHRILEVGSGPIGTVNYLPWGECYALDPLENFYATNQILIRLRKPHVHYISGSGEKLPFPDEWCSLVIIDNVLDHTHDPEKVLGEIWRVLTRQGLLYIAVNIRNLLGERLHIVLAHLWIDKGHPHSFTQAKIRDCLSRKGLRIRKEEVEDYHKIRQANRSSKNFKNKIKGYTGLSEFQYYAICSKDLSSER